MSKYKKLFCMFLILLLAVCLLSTTAFAAGTGDVAGAIEGTWNDASDQIKTVVNNVVFPVIDLIQPLPACVFPALDSQNALPRRRDDLIHGKIFSDHMRHIKAV